MNDEKSLRDHVAEVHRWVDANKRVYSDIKTIKLMSVQIDRSDFSGSAELILDDRMPPEDLSISLGGDGWLTFSLPMFHSPLGAPASFSAVVLTEAASRAVASVVRGLLPRVLPFGLHPITKQWITQSTPLSERVVSHVEFEAAFARIHESTFTQIVRLNEGEALP